MEYQSDVLIIGAGMTGISAARTIEEHNRSGGHKPLTYTVLEATDRIGGRIKSDFIHLDDIHVDGKPPIKQKPIKIERGAQWLHTDIRDGSAPNPLITDATDAGLDLILDTMPREFYKGGQRQSYNGKIRLIQTARQLIDGHRDKDTSVKALLDSHSLVSDSAINTTFGPVETGATTDKTSVIDIQKLVACNRGHFTRQPLSQMVEHMAKDVRPNIKLDCPIAELHWKMQGQGAMVKLKNGDIYRAKRIMLSPSVGVLRSGDIKIVPPLPESHSKPLENIHMGNFNKVFLVFDKRFKMPVNANTHMDVETRDGKDIFYLAKDNGQQLVTTFFGDDLARDCDKDPQKAMDLAINSLAEIWGPDVKKYVLRDKCITTQWGNEPYVQGGYSRVNIGCHDVRQQLAEPLNDTLYLAGEGIGAINPETGQNWATHMPGAMLSGRRAALEICKSLAVTETVEPLGEGFAKRLR